MAVSSSIPPAIFMAQPCKAARTTEVPSLSCRPAAVGGRKRSYIILAVEAMDGVLGGTGYFGR